MRKVITMQWRFCTKKEFIPFRAPTLALAGVAQWIELQPANQRVDSQAGHMPRMCTKSPVGGVHERQPHSGVYLPPFLSL